MDIIDLKIGSTLLIDDQVYIVTELHYSETNVVVMLENVETGKTIEKTVSADNDIELVSIVVKEMQYSYEDNGLYYFMDIDSMEQQALSYDMVKDYMKYITEDSIVTMKFVKDKLLSIEHKPNVALEVDEIVSTTKSGKQKAHLETDIVVKVPSDVHVGDKVLIDTTNGQFVDKA